MAVVKIVPMPGVAVVGPTGAQGPIGLTGPAGQDGADFDSSNGLVVTGYIDDEVINPSGAMALSVGPGYSALMDLSAHNATFNGSVYISNLGEDKQTTIDTPTLITNDLYVTGKINGGTAQIILRRNESLPLGPSAPLTLIGNSGGYGIPFDSEVFSNKISWSNPDYAEAMDIVFQESGIYTLDLSAQFAKNENVPVADVAIYTLAYVPTPPTWNPTKFDGSLRVYSFKSDYGTISYNSIITIPHGGYRARVFIWSPHDCALSNIETNFISSVANPSSGACTLIVTKLADIE